MSRAVSPEEQKERERQNQMLLAAVAGGCALAMLLGIGKLVADMRASRRETPLRPWEKDVPEA